VTQPPSPRTDSCGTLALRSALHLLIACLAVPIACAQSPAPSPAASPADPYAEHPPIPYAPIDPVTIPHIDFDVATFKLNKTGGVMPYIQIPADGDGFTAQNRPIHDLIRYGFSRGRGGTYRISGQPAWVDEDRYDIQAKVAPEELAKWKALSPIGKRLAFQGFLIEYLKLQYHQDESDRPYYALVVARNGPKMQVAHANEAYKDPRGQPVAHRTLLWISPSDVIGFGCEMERFADELTSHTDRPVLDKTGLRDYYNFTIHFDGAPNPDNPAAPEIPFLGLRPDLATPSVLSSIKELGLEIKPAKGPLDGMVIDHIERPPEN
jgi:uncharacterized protein (TIGR03435 family)